MKDIVRLGLDVYHGTVNTEFTNGEDAEVKLREALIKANGGSDKIDLRTMRGNKTEIFEIIEEIIEIVVNEGLQGDEFFMQFVDYRNMKRGDKNEFVIEEDSQFIVADMADGIATPRRQRIGARTSRSINTTVSGVRVYEEMNRLLSGAISWGTFIDKVSKAVTEKRYEKIYTAFSGLTEATPGLSKDYVYAGSYDEELLIQMVERVEAVTGAPAKIVGSKPALRKITTAIMSHEAESNYHNIGFFGKLAGIDMLAVTNRFKAGSQEYILPNDTVWVVAGDDQFIKFVDEGDALILDKDPTANADLTQEYTYIDRTGCAVIMCGKIGKYQFI